MIDTDYRLSILVPGLNAEPYIENCLDTLLENDYENYKIYVIIGGTDQGYNISLQYQKEHPNKIRAIEQKVPSKNKALNLALKEIDGDIIIITDIDCIYPKNWLSKINDIFQDKKHNVITSLYLPYESRKGSLAEFNNIRHGSWVIRHEDGGIISGRKLWGGCAAFRRNVFEKKIGKFEEYSKTGDDKILGMQFNEKGEDLYYFRDLYVYTECYSDSIKKFTKRRIRWARDLFITGQKINYFKIIVLLGIGLFKFFYPILALIFTLLFFNLFYFWLFMLPWFGAYLYFLLLNYFQLKKKNKKIKVQLNKNFNHKKAFKIVPLLYFIFGIINIIGFANINPKKRKWYH